ncbi:MAG: succinate--CoA ligase subunit alpha [Gammaproteobacteria bacterium]
MSILVDKNTRVLCQGITGHQASFYVERAISFGTQMVAGVRPGKGGSSHLGLPVFDRVADARRISGANASVIFVPRAHAAGAIIEAVEAGIELIVCISKHIPALDMLRVLDALEGCKSRLIGPNTPGIITPGECRIGIMPGEIFRRGAIGIISRSSTLTYEAIAQTTAAGLGQSTCAGIGGDPLHGLGFADFLELFKHDDETEAVVLIGEIGGSEEAQAAEYLRAGDYGKPVIAYIAGMSAPDNTRMGHAGAIIQNGFGGAEEKKRALGQAGVILVESPVTLGHAVARALA